MPTIRSLLSVLETVLPNAVKKHRRGVVPIPNEWDLKTGFNHSFFCGSVEPNQMRRLSLRGEEGEKSRIAPLSVA